MNASFRGGHRLVLLPKEGSQLSLSLSLGFEGEIVRPIVAETLSTAQKCHRQSLKMNSEARNLVAARPCQPTSERGV
jgi:hypothetical protein